jgi:hypothetical protein
MSNCPVCYNKLIAMKMALKQLEHLGKHLILVAGILVTSPSEIKCEAQEAV